MSKQILITGGAGFVGSHLADALLMLGHQVRVFDNFSPQVHVEGFPAYLSPDVELMVGDMRDYNAVGRALKGVEVVFHLAAAVGVGQSMYEIVNYVGSNTQGTAVLLQAILDSRMGLEKLVVASSMSVYGEGKYLCAECGEVAPLPRSSEQLLSKLWETACPKCQRTVTPVPTDESKPTQCNSIYAISKKDQEEMCLLFGRTYRVPTVALRCFNIYGTRQTLSNPYTGVAAIFAARLLNGKAPLIFEDGRQMRDFVSVHDAVRANVLAMQSKTEGVALNIGSGWPITIAEIANVLSNALDVALPAEITDKFRSGDVRHCFADISAARRLLGYEPKIKFSDGVVELVDWLRSQQPEDRVSMAAAELDTFGLSA